MTLNYTPRLGLNKPDQDEFQLIDTLNANADKLDTWVGAKMVTAGIIPPVNQLYDGLIVNERDTGKTWIASDNGSGGFDRAWIRYPWFINGNSASFTLANNSSVVPAVTFGSGLNSSSADIVSGRCKVPISGIYELDISVNFGANAVSSVNWRSISYERNLVDQVWTCDYNPINQNNSAHRFHFHGMPLQLTAGDAIGPQAFQNSGSPMPGTTVSICLTLIQVTGKNNN
jgi:hypothetical protein